MILQSAVRLVFISTWGDAAHSFTVYRQYKITPGLNRYRYDTDIYGTESFFQFSDGKEVVTLL